MNYKTQTRNQASLLSSGKFWALTLLLILIYTAFIFAQSTVYIDPTNSGDPGQNGTIDHPYDSWYDLHYALQSNTIYLQKAGTIYYYSTGGLGCAIVINKENISFGSYGVGAKPIIEVTPGGSPCHFYIKNSKNISVDGFELIGNGGNQTFYACSYNPGNKCEDLEIKNCDIHNAYAAVYLFPFEDMPAISSDGLNVINCNIWDIDGDGMFITSADDVVIDNCHLWNINTRWLKGGIAPGDGIQLTGLCKRPIIKNSIIDRRTTAGKFSVIVSSESHDPEYELQFTGNTIYPPKDTCCPNVGGSDPNGAGLYIEGLPHIVVAYNKFIGRNYPDGVKSVPAIAFPWNDTVDFYYNIIDSVPPTGWMYGTQVLHFNNNTVVSNTTGDAIIDLSGQQGGEVRNNIAAANTTHPPIWVQTSPNVIQSNNLYTTGGPSTWNAFLGITDWENSNFHIEETSTARNTGYNYNDYFFDMDSISVPQENIRDKGACEYTDGSQTTNNPPVISNQAFTINENTVNGTIVGTVVASDPDAGQTLTYSITSGNTSNAFQINFSTGALSVNNSAALNYEAITTFGLTVRAQDNGQGNLYSQATVTVNLTDINENPNIGNQTFSLAENSSNGQQVGVVVATDPDAGQTLSYSIISGNTGSAFAINTGTGALTVNNSTALNYELTTSFGLTVRAQDNGQGNLYSQATVTVNLTDVNENPNIGDQTFWVPENSPNGYQVGLVIANDPDIGQLLTYSILGGNTDNAFTINTSTGALIVTNSSALNSAVNPVFSLILEVADNGPGNLSSQALITVYVTDLNQPPQISNQAFSITENSPNGQQVGTVVATDPDAGQTLTYSIIDGNTDNAFAINANTGVLIVNNSSALNYEVTTSFGLTVRAQDNGQGNLYSQAVVTVNLMDINENPGISNQAFSINENSPDGQQVGTVVATDPDAGQTLTYSIINGNTYNAFAINENTGDLSVNNSVALNYEVIMSFGLTVQVLDNGQGNLYSQAVITVNLIDINENPDISNQTFYIEENSPNGYLAGMVVASDPDAGQTLTYSIIDGNTDNAFAIDANTGGLIVNNSSVLNFEINPFFWLTIRVQDNGPGNLFSQAIITVGLMNINVNIHQIILGLQATCHIYPNPAYNFINVNIVNFEEELVIISLIDVSGEVIIRQECEVLDGSSLKRIDIEELGKGLYIVSIQAGDRMFFEKFIKLL